MWNKVLKFLSQWFRRLGYALINKEVPKKPEVVVIEEPKGLYIGQKVSHETGSGEIIEGKITGITDTHVAVDWAHGVSLKYSHKHDSDFIQGMTER